VTVDMLFVEFTRLNDAPGALSRLREFTLDLALRGRLVDQRTTDEPIDELMGRIASAMHAEPRSIHSAGRGEPRPAFIPATWAWVRLGDIAAVTMGQSPPGDTYNTEGVGVPLINGPVEFSPEPFGTTIVNQYTTTPTKMCEAGDLLLCVRGSTTGRTNVAGQRACLGRGVAAIRPVECDSYVRLFIWHQRKAILALGRGIAFPSISRDQVMDMRVPLPPLPEQQRIVAKVGELMALYDELEAAQLDRDDKRFRYATAALHQLTDVAGEDSAAFRKAITSTLTRVQNFTATPHLLPLLRRTIIDLAVRGRLVEQDQSEEPASILLQRIADERSRLDLTPARRDVARQPEPEGGRDIAVPSGWATTSLGDVIRLVSGQHLKPSEYSSNERDGIPYVTGPADFGSGGLVISRYALVRRAVATEGQVLLTVKGAGVGKTAICTLREVAISRQLMAMEPILWSSEYLLLLTHSLTDRLVSRMRSLIPGITRRDVDSFVFALPPRGEQTRIVAKVQELMGVCDDLEDSLSAVEAGRANLLEAILRESLNEDRTATGRATAAAQ
jgi:type I restriction enzyme, S subunit